MRGKSWAVLFILVCAAGFAAGQTTTRESVNAAGAEGNLGSEEPQIAWESTVLVFTSRASNLVSGDTNNAADVFYRSRDSGNIELVSVGAGSRPANGDSVSPSVSTDGRYIAFSSWATNIVSSWPSDPPAVYLRDRVSSTTVAVSMDRFGRIVNGTKPSISADGRYVAFESTNAYIVVGDNNYATDVFVWDRLTGWITRASVSSFGIQGDAASDSPAISADGRLVAFRSFATNLVRGDTNNAADIFVHDCLSGETARVSVDFYGREANGYSLPQPAISADNRFVAFATTATNLDPRDTVPDADVYVYDRQTGASMLVSHDFVRGKGNADSYTPVISAGGRAIAFASRATNFDPADMNGAADIFFSELLSLEPPLSRVTRMSVGALGREGEYGADSSMPAISASGRFVAFQSQAARLVPDDRNNAPDVFLRDRVEGAQGTVNGGAGPVTDVLFANGENRVLSIPTGMPIVIQFNPAPAGPQTAVWGFWGWLGPPMRQTDIYIYGQGAWLGWTVNPTAFSWWLSPQPVYTVVGSSLPQALHLTVPIPIIFTVQGIVEDRGASNSLRVSTTNAVIVEVTP